MDYRAEASHNTLERGVDFVVGLLLLSATLLATTLGHTADVQSDEVEISNFLQTMKKIWKDIELADVSAISRELGIRFTSQKVDTGPNPEITLINYLPEGSSKLPILVDSEFRYRIRGDAVAPTASATIAFGVDFNKLCITREAMEKVFGSGRQYFPLPHPGVNRGMNQGVNAVAKETDYAGFTYIFRRPQSAEVRFVVGFDWKKCLRNVTFTNL